MTPLHFTKFNDKVHQMNTGHINELKMSSAEARALLHDMFAILAELNAFRAASIDEVIEIVIDAGNNSL